MPFLITIFSHHPFSVHHSTAWLPLHVSQDGRVTKQLWDLSDFTQSRSISHLSCMIKKVQKSPHSPSSIRDPGWWRLHFWTELGIERVWRTHCCPTCFWLKVPLVTLLTVRWPKLGTFATLTGREMEKHMNLSCVLRKRNWNGLIMDCSTWHVTAYLFYVYSRPKFLCSPDFRCFSPPHPQPCNFTLGS